jgi:acylphosphatase
LDEKTRYEIDMLRAKIIARGDFQRVGFRDVVQKIARNMGLTGTVQNLEPYDVRKLQLEYTQIAHKSCL